MLVQLSALAGKMIFLAPIISVILIIGNRIWNRKVSEKLVSKIILYAQSISLISLIPIFAQFISDTNSKIKLFTIDILKFGESTLRINFLIDFLSLPFLTLTILLGAIVGVFASRYLHRDPGYFRFFLLYHIFLFGMFLIVLSGDLSGIFIGWEIVGLTSALLIAFFAYRKQTVTSSLRAFWAYRVTDTGLLLASLISASIHTDISAAHGASAVNFTQNIILILCLLSAMGKSAQFPFGHWLPKAMEGPTPSSAIFYGGLAVHAGVYLILRVTQGIVQPLWFSILLFSIGLATAIYGSLLSKIQSDVKSTLAFSSMTQTGIMFCELGLQLRTVAVAHCVGHALLRTYQLLNASSQLHDHLAFQDSMPVKNRKILESRFWTKFYSSLFWENYSGIGDRWSLLRSIESLSSLLRRFDQRCNSLLHKFFKKAFWFWNPRAQEGIQK